MPHIIFIGGHDLVATGLLHFCYATLPAAAIELVADVDRLEAMLNVDSSATEQLVIADVWPNEENSLNKLKALKSRHHCFSWIAISGNQDPGLESRVRLAGADGFVHRQNGDKTIAEAISSIRAGQSFFRDIDGEKKFVQPTSPRREVTPNQLRLTPRQNEIVQLVLQGFSNKLIAKRMGIAESTVKEHMTGILERLEVRTRVQLVSKLSELKLQQVYFEQYRLLTRPLEAVGASLVLSAIN